MNIEIKMFLKNRFYCMYYWDIFSVYQTVWVSPIPMLLGSFKLKMTAGVGRKNRSYESDLAGEKK